MAHCTFSSEAGELGLIRYMNSNSSGSKLQLNGLSGQWVGCLLGRFLYDIMFIMLHTCRGHKNLLWISDIVSRVVAIKISKLGILKKISQASQLLSKGLHWEFHEPNSGWDLVTRSIWTFPSGRSQLSLILFYAGKEFAKKDFHTWQDVGKRGGSWVTLEICPLFSKSTCCWQTRLHEAL